MRQYKHFQVLFFHSLRKGARVPTLTLLHKSEQSQRHWGSHGVTISVLYPKSTVMLLNGQWYREMAKNLAHKNQQGKLSCMAIQETTKETTM